MAEQIGQFEIGASVNTTKAEAQINQFFRNFENRSLRLSLNSNSFSQPLGRITGNVAEFSKSLQAAEARVIAFSATASILFGITKAFQSLFSSTIDVQKSLTDINVILSLSAKSLQTFGVGLFDISKQTGQSFKEVATAATELARQGLGVEQTLQRTRDALILTRLSGLDAKESVEALTASLNSFQESALDSTALINKLANVDASFAVSTKDLAEGIKRVGSSAEEAGLSIDQLIALITSAQQTTARGGAVIAGALNTIFTRIQRPQVLSQLEEVGVTIRKVSGEILPTLDLLKNISDFTQNANISIIQKNQIEELVGGVRQLNILRATLSDLSKENSVYSNALNTSVNATDQAIKRNEELNTTFAALLQITKNNITQAGSTIGKGAVGPLLKNSLDFTNAILGNIGGKGGDGALADAGGKIGQGVINGIGQFISGPGAIYLTIVLAKLATRFITFAKEITQGFVGIGKSFQDQKFINEQINNYLAQNPRLIADSVSGLKTQLQVEQEILGTLRAQTVVRQEGLRLSNTIGPSLYRAGQVSVTETESKTKILTAPIGKRAAVGLIPEFEEKSGALRGGYVPGEVKQTNIPKLGPVFYNTAEKIVKYPQFEQPAIIPPQQSKAGREYKEKFLKTHGFNPYLNNGLVPNYTNIIGFHGTSSLFNQFLPTKGLRYNLDKESSIISPSTFFSENKNVAEKFAFSKYRQTGNTPRIITASIDSSNPLDLTRGIRNEKGEFVPQLLQSKLLKELTKKYKLTDVNSRDLFRLFDNPELVSRLQKEGFSSAIFDEFFAKSHAVFDKNKINIVSNEKFTGLPKFNKGLVPNYARTPERFNKYAQFLYKKSETTNPYAIPEEELIKKYGEKYYDHPEFESKVKETRKNRDNFDLFLKKGVLRGLTNYDSLRDFKKSTYVIEANYKPKGSDIDNFGQLTTLPKDLYHVTSNFPEFQKTGVLKSRKELNLQSGTGLGGGDDNTISFTGSHKTGRAIQRSIVELSSLLSGRRTVSDLIDRAKTGFRAKKPFIDDFTKFTESSVGHGMLEALQTGKITKTDFYFNESGLQKIKDKGATDIKTGGGYAQYTLPLTDEDKKRYLPQVYSAFSYAQEHADGYLNPLFFTSDYEKISKLEKKDVKLLKFSPKKQNELGLELGALGEYRVHEGKRFDLKEVYNKGLIPSYASPYSLGYSKFKPNIFGLKDIFKDPKGTLERLPFRVAGSLGALGAGLFTEHIQKEPLLAQQYYSGARYLSGLGGKREINISNLKDVRQGLGSRPLDELLLAKEGLKYQKNNSASGALNYTIGGFSLTKNKKGPIIQDPFDFDNSIQDELYGPYSDQYNPNPRNESKSFGAYIDITKYKKYIDKFFNKFGTEKFRKTEEYTPIKSRQIKFGPININQNDLAPNRLNIQGDDLDFAKYGSPFLTRIKFPGLNKGLVPNYANFPITEELTTILNKIVKSGGKPVITGGSVRDFFIDKRAPKDFDVEVFNLEQEKLIQSLSEFGKVDEVGKSFGVIKLGKYDFSLPRTERKTGIGHKGFEVVSDPNISYQEAASRRDLTINSIGYDFQSQSFLDPFGGRQDIEKGILKPVSEKFKEDPLRVLRSAQFASRFGFEADPKLIQYSKELNSEIPSLPKERLYTEFEKIATKSKQPSKGLRFLEQTETLKNFPQISRLRNVPQSPIYHPEGDVLEHTFHVMDELNKLPGFQNLDNTGKAQLMFTALGHDFGKFTHTKIEGGKISSPGHEKASVPIFDEFLSSIKAPNVIGEKARPLISEHGALFGFKEKEGITPTAVRRLARRISPATLEELDLIFRADKLGRPGTTPKFDKIDRVQELSKQLNLSKEAPKPILQGRDLLALGVKPGPEMGIKLKELMEAQLEGKFSSPEEGIDYFKKNFNKGLVPNYSYPMGIPNGIIAKGSAFRRHNEFQERLNSEAFQTEKGSVYWHTPDNETYRRKYLKSFGLGSTIHGKHPVRYVDEGGANEIFNLYDKFTNDPDAKSVFDKESFVINFSDGTKNQFPVIDKPKIGLRPIEISNDNPHIGHPIVKMLNKEEALNFENFKNKGFIPDYTYKNIQPRISSLHDIDDSLAQLIDTAPEIGKIRDLIGEKPRFQFKSPPSIGQTIRGQFDPKNLGSFPLELNRSVFSSFHKNKNPNLQPEILRTLGHEAAHQFDFSIDKRGGFGSQSVGFKKALNRDRAKYGGFLNELAETSVLADPYSESYAELFGKGIINQPFSRRISSFAFDREQIPFEDLHSYKFFKDNGLLNKGLVPNYAVYSTLKPLPPAVQEQYEKLHGKTIPLVFGEHSQQEFGKDLKKYGIDSLGYPSKNLIIDPSKIFEIETDDITGQIKKIVQEIHPPKNSFQDRKHVLAVDPRESKISGFPFNVKTFYSRPTGQGQIIGQENIFKYANASRGEIPNYAQLFKRQHGLPDFGNFEPHLENFRNIPNIFEKNQFLKELEQSGIINFLGQGSSRKTFDIGNNLALKFARTDDFRKLKRGIAQNKIEANPIFDEYRDILPFIKEVGRDYSYLISEKARPLNFDVFKRKTGLDYPSYLGGGEDLAASKHSFPRRYDELYKDKRLDLVHDLGSDNFGTGLREGELSPLVIDVGLNKEVAKRLYNFHFNKGLVPNYNQSNPILDFISKQGGNISAKSLKEYNNIQIKLAKELGQNMGLSPEDLLGNKTFQDSARNLIKKNYYKGEIPNYAEFFKVAYRFPDGKVRVGRKGEMMHSQLAKRLSKSYGRMWGDEEDGFYSPVLKKFLTRDEASILQGYNADSFGGGGISLNLSKIHNGLIPNYNKFIGYNNPLSNAIERENKAGIPISQIRVGQSSILKGTENPLGLGVYNTKDEPLGLNQGINRVANMGLDPKRSGMYNRGKVPNFADQKDIKSESEKFGQSAIIRSVIPEFEKLKKSLSDNSGNYGLASSELNNLIKSFKLTSDSASILHKELLDTSNTLQKGDLQSSVLKGIQRANEKIPSSQNFTVIPNFPQETQIKGQISYPGAPKQIHPGNPEAGGLIPTVLSTKTFNLPLETPSDKITQILKKVSSKITNDILEKSATHAETTSQVILAQQTRTAGQKFNAGKFESFQVRSSLINNPGAFFNGTPTQGPTIPLSNNALLKAFTQPTQGDLRLKSQQDLDSLFADVSNQVGQKAKLLSGGGFTEDKILRDSFSFTNSKLGSGGASHINDLLGGFSKGISTGEIKDIEKATAEILKVAEQNVRELGGNALTEEEIGTELRGIKKFTKDTANASKKYADLVAQGILTQRETSEALQKQRNNLESLGQKATTSFFGLPSFSSTNKKKFEEAAQKAIASGAIDQEGVTSLRAGLVSQRQSNFQNKAFLASFAIPIVAETLNQFVSQETRGGRATSSVVSAVSNIGGLAATGAVIGNVPGAIAGGTIGLLSSIPEIMKGFLSTLPDLQRELEKLTETSSKTQDTLSRLSQVHQQIEDITEGRVKVSKGTFAKLQAQERQEFSKLGREDVNSLIQSLKTEGISGLVTGSNQINQRQNILRNSQEFLVTTRAKEETEKFSLSNIRIPGTELPLPGLFGVPAAFKAAQQTFGAGEFSPVQIQKKNKDLTDLTLSNLQGFIGEKGNLTDFLSENVDALNRLKEDTNTPEKFSKDILDILNKLSPSTPKGNEAITKAIDIANKLSGGVSTKNVITQLTDKDILAARKEGTDTLTKFLKEGLTNAENFNEQLFKAGLSLSSFIKTVEFTSKSQVQAGAAFKERQQGFFGGIIKNQENFLQPEALAGLENRLNLVGLETDKNLEIRNAQIGAGGEINKSLSQESLRFLAERFQHTLEPTGSTNKDEILRNTAEFLAPIKAQNEEISKIFAAGNFKEGQEAVKNFLETLNTKRAKLLEQPTNLENKNTQNLVEREFLAAAINTVASSLTELDGSINLANQKFIESKQFQDILNKAKLDDISIQKKINFGGGIQNLLAPTNEFAQSLFGARAKTSAGAGLGNETLKSQGLLEIGGLISSLGATVPDELKQAIIPGLSSEIDKRLGLVSGTIIGKNSKGENLTSADLAKTQIENIFKGESLNAETNRAVLSASQSLDGGIGELNNFLRTATSTGIKISNFDELKKALNEEDIGKAVGKICEAIEDQIKSSTNNTLNADISSSGKISSSIKANTRVQEENEAVKKGIKALEFYNNKNEGIGLPPFPNNIPPTIKQLQSITPTFTVNPEPLKGFDYKSFIEKNKNKPSSYIEEYIPPKEEVFSQPKPSFINEYLGNLFYKFVGEQFPKFNSPIIKKKESTFSQYGPEEQLGPFLPVLPKLSDASFNNDILLRSFRKDVGSITGKNAGIGISNLPINPAIPRLSPDVKIQIDKDEFNRLIKGGGKLDFPANLPRNPSDFLSTSKTTGDLLNSYYQFQDKSKKILDSTVDGVQKQLALERALLEIEKERVTEQYKLGTASGEELANIQHALNLRKIQDNGRVEPKEIFKSFGDQFNYNSKDLYKELENGAVDLGQTIKSSLKDGFKEFENGKKPLDALRDYALNVFHKILDQTTSIGINSLFNLGKTGLTSLFSQKSQGGIIGYSSGGKVVGGSGTKDDVLAALTKGEFVVNKAAVQKYGESFLSNLNAQRPPPSALSSPIVPSKNPFGSQYDKVVSGFGSDFTENRSVINDISKQYPFPPFITPKEYSSVAGTSDQAKIFLANEIRYDNPRNPSKILYNVDTGRLSNFALEDENNPQNALRLKRESDFFNYLNELSQFEEQKKKALQQFKRSQDQRLIGAYISAATTIAGSYIGKAAAGAKGASLGQSLGSATAGGVNSGLSSQGTSFTGNIGLSNNYPTGGQPINFNERQPFGSQGLTFGGGSGGGYNFNNNTIEQDLKLLNEGNLSSYYRPPSYPYGAPILTRASGGSVYQPRVKFGGNQSTDTIPTLLTDGEFVIRKNIVDRYGVQYFNDLNRQKIRGYADGGLVGDSVQTNNIAGQDYNNGLIDTLNALISTFKDYQSNLNNKRQDLVPETNGRNNSPIQPVSQPIITINVTIDKSGNANTQTNTQGSNQDQNNKTGETDQEKGRKFGEVVKGLVVKEILVQKRPGGLLY